MAATVTGRITNSRGEGLISVDVELELVELMDLTQTYLSKLSEFQTDPTGNFVLTPVYQGRYIIRYGRETIRIQVPSSTGVYVVSNILEKQ